MTLLLGPLLRRVAGDRATVWVETSAPATVAVRAGAASGAARTFTAFGRYYALVVVDGLPAGTVTPYRVLVDGEPAWPPPGDERPPPVIRTRAEAAPVRIVFGSCREVGPQAAHRMPPDALDGYAVRLAATGRDWPDTLVLLGDQVYADEPAGDEAADFAGYARLYHESWLDPDVRWLLSTVPSVMIFDDHEVVDDWNTSAPWRARMLARPGWTERITVALASYWVYQHLGNLHPDELGSDPVYEAVVSAPDATGVLREFGAGADADRSRYRWSFALDVGRTRVVVLDNRCARELTPGRRSMLPDAQWEWFAAMLRGGGYDHLVAGSSLPWLMPFGVHHLERAVAALAESRYRAVAAPSEWLRQALDLEHWAAFGGSFDALAALLAQVAAGDLGSRPASVTVLSGDVHHSYVARAALAGAPVHQVTCSPVHNRVPPAMRVMFRTAWSRVAARTGQALCRAVRLAPTGLRWTKLAGPYFGTVVGTLVHSGRSGHVLIEGTGGDGALVPVARVALTGAAGDDGSAYR
jgi:hypothetical protein